MNPSDERIIGLSKIKILLVITSGCVFIAIGAWLLFMDAAEFKLHHRFNNPLIVHGAGLLSIALGVVYSRLWVKKLLEKKPGLIFSSAGIIDNSSCVSAGLIPWSEFVALDVCVVTTYYKALVIKVTHPEKYIANAGLMRRLHISPIYKVCGSPILISASSLKITFDELVDTCNQFFSKYGNMSERGHR